MTVGDKTCLKRGNSCLEEFLSIIKVCLEHNVPVSLEQPANSMMWQIPELLAVRRSEMASFGKLEVDYCKFGRPFKKPTMVWFLGTLSLFVVLFACPLFSFFSTILFLLFFFFFFFSLMLMLLIRC